MTNPNNPDAPSAADDYANEQLVRTSLGDWVFPSLNGTSFSKNRARKVLADHFGERLHQQDRLYVIVGSDSGNLIDFVRSQGELPRGSRWVFIEPEEIRNALVNQAGIREKLDEYVRLIALEEWSEHADALQLDAYFRIDGVIFERSLAALDGNHPVYDAITETLDAELTRQRYLVTANLNLAPFIRAQITNTPNFTTGVRVLENAFNGKTAMVLAGGPSLDQFIPWIASHRDHLFLIAVSRISGRLRTAGIDPDLVVTVDPYPVSMMVSRHMFDFAPTTVLVAGNHAYPGIINRWPHAILHTDRLLPWQDDTVETIQNLEAAGPTVTHTATVLADYLGFKTILFAGLDLCHAPNGQTHASGSNEAAAGPLLDYTALRVETNTGDIAFTTPDYYEGIDSMARIVKQLQEHGVRCMNPSPNAARIDGVRHLPIEQIAIPATPFDRKALDSVIRNQEKVSTGFHENLDTALAGMEEKISKIERLAQLAQESNRAYFHTVNADRQKLHNRRMQAIDRLMRRQLGQAEAVVKQMAARALLKTDLPHDFFDLEPEHAEALANHFYGTLQNQAHAVLPVLENARFRIETRQMERDPTTPTATLVERYLEGMEPERGFWLAAHRQQALEEVTPAEEKHEEWLERVIAHFDEKNRERRTPKASLRLAEMHFSHRNIRALSALQAALAQHPEQNTAASYHAFLKGLLAELGQDAPEAFAQYEQVLNHADQQEDARLIEHALLRIASVSLMTENPEQASQALETAALINAAHWAHVAQLARMMDQPQKAIEALSHYLQHFPGDSRRLLQLAEIFASQNLPEGISACRELLPYCPPAQQTDIEAQLATMLGESA